MRLLTIDSRLDAIAGKPAGMLVKGVAMTHTLIGSLR